MNLKIGLIITFILLLFTLSVYAQQNYADIKIDVTNSGLVTITGETDYQELLAQDSPDYTSKKGKYWVLNISINKKFSDLVYVLNLPENSKINYLKTPSLTRIEDEDKGISIIGTAQNKPFTLIVQYSIGQNKISTNFTIVFLTIFLPISVLFILIKKKKRPKISFNKDSLTQRQKQILKIVEKSRKPVTQARIEKISKLPKSSLSRNIESLVRKQVLKKEARGMSNIISLNKKP